MQVKYFANIRELTGKKEETLAAPATVSALMLALCDAYGREFRAFCMDGSAISRRVNILVNGKHIAHLKNDETPLSEEDGVSIFPLIGGG